MISLESDDPLPRPHTLPRDFAVSFLTSCLRSTLSPHSSDRAVASRHRNGPHTRLPHGKASIPRQLWPLQAPTHLLDSSTSVPCEIPVLTRHITAMGVSSGVTFQLLELQQAACESLVSLSVRTSNMVDTKAGLPLSSMRVAVMPTTLIMSFTISALDGMIY